MYPEIDMPGRGRSDVAHHILESLPTIFTAQSYSLQYLYPFLALLLFSFLLTFEQQTALGQPTTWTPYDTFTLPFLHSAQLLPSAPLAQSDSTSIHPITLRHIFYSVETPVVMALSFDDDSDSRQNHDLTAPHTIDLFDPNIIIRNAERRCSYSQGAKILVNAALEEIQRLAATQPGPLSRERAIRAVQLRIRAEISKIDGIQPPESPDGNEDAVEIGRDLILAMIEDEIQKLLPAEDSLPKIEVQEKTVDGRKVMRYKFNKPALGKYFEGKDPYGDDLASQMNSVRITDTEPGRDIITKLCVNVELAVQLGKQLRPEDILNLYIASKGFRDAVNGYMLSSIRIWIADRCPEAGRIFPFKLYKNHLVHDPWGRTWADMYKDSSSAAPMTPERLEKIRTVPGLKYMQLVLGRDRYCREITAMMARNGHLMPRSMHDTLLRLWLLMDTGYTEHRRAMLRNPKLWRDEDLYNAQLLFVKLGMHFNDPVFGPSSYELLHLILGQRGLYPLWQLLMRKRFTTLSEIVEAKVRYDFDLTPDHLRECLPRGGHLHSVSLWQVGTGHREGWGDGTSRQHLMRPDELVPVEAVTRGLQLDDHIRHMILWGYFDWETGENIVPTEEDMYISDEETTLAHMDTRHHWRKKHSLKKRWDTLSPEQQAEIREDDEDEQLRAMAWCGNEDDEDDSEYDWAEEDTYSLNDEIKRGFIVPAQSPDHKSTVPTLDDKDGWADFVTRTLMGTTLELDEDEALRMQAFNPALSDDNFDWIAWMREEGFDVDEYHKEEAESTNAEDVNMGEE